MSVISESLTELRGELKGAEEHLLEDRFEFLYMKVKVFFLYERESLIVEL